MKLSEFTKGQRVKTYDPDDNRYCYGIVERIEGISVWIKWDDLNEPVEHNDETDLNNIYQRNSIY